MIGTPIDLAMWPIGVVIIGTVTGPIGSIGRVPATTASTRACTSMTTPVTSSSIVGEGCDLGWDGAWR
jgi:hypothetical protein